MDFALDTYLPLLQEQAPSRHECFAVGKESGEAAFEALNLLIPLQVPQVSRACLLRDHGGPPVRGEIDLSDGVEMSTHIKLCPGEVGVIKPEAGPFLILGSLSRGDEGFPA